MRDNWIRNSEGIWFNLDKIGHIAIGIFDEAGVKTFVIKVYDEYDSYLFDLELIEFNIEKEAQDHLDNMMKQK